MHVKLYIRILLHQKKRLHCVYKKTICMQQDVNNSPDSYSTVAFRSWLPILLLTNFKFSQYYYYYILQIVQGGNFAWFSQIDLQPQKFSSEIIGMATYTTMEP